MNSQIPPQSGWLDEWFIKIGIIGKEQEIWEIIVGFISLS